MPPDGLLKRSVARHNTLGLIGVDLTSNKDMSMSALVSKALFHGSLHKLHVCLCLSIVHDTIWYMLSCFQNSSNFSETKFVPTSENILLGSLSSKGIILNVLSGYLH